MLTSSPPTSAPGTDKTGMDFRRILPEIRCQSCLSPGSEPTARGGFSPPVNSLRPKTDHAKRSSVPPSYLPTTRIENESGNIGPRAGPRPPRPCGGAPPAGGVAGGGGGGPYSAAIVSMWFVFVSNVSVLAPAIVWRSCSTAKLVGLFSLTIVLVPLPCELKASIVAGLNTAPSEPPASGSEVMILPSSALRITIMGCAGVTAGIPDCPQAAKRT